MVGLINAPKSVLENPLSASKLDLTATVFVLVIRHMDHFSVNQVRLGDGRLAAQYAVCVPDYLLNKALESDTELKKHLPVENDKHFSAKAAAILGGIICAGDCSGRFNQWVSSAIPEATALLQKPADLGEPTPSMVENEYPGVKIWLLKTEVSRQPYP